MSKKGVNTVILVGNIGKDPEIRYGADGGAIANLTLATSESWKDKATGQPQERTEWHRIAIYGKLAEIAGEYVKKGSKIYISGALRTRKWTNQEGKDQYTTEIVVNELQMLDSKGESSQSGYKRMDGKPELQQQQAPQFDDSENIPF